MVEPALALMVRLLEHEGGTRMEMRVMCFQSLYRISCGTSGSPAARRSGTGLPSKDGPSFVCWRRRSHVDCKVDHPRLSPITLSGSIVRLEPLLPTHAPDLAAVGLEPELWRLQPKVIASLADMEAYVASALEDQRRGESLCFVVVSQHTGGVIGTTRFMDIAPAHKRVEIGWTWITSAHQRTGANVEAKLLLLTHAFDVLGVQKVVLKTETLNEQSRRAILALGATQEGTLRRQFLADDGRARDMVYFSILDSEWPGVRDRLAARLTRSTCSE